MTLSGQTYTCSAGETFDNVALEVYVVEVSEEDEDDDYMPATAPWKE